MTEYRYRTWGGNPKGDPVDPTRCVADVADGGRSVLSHQCYNKRGHGPNGDLCGVHANMLHRGINVYPMGWPKTS